MADTSRLSPADRRATQQLWIRSLHEVGVRVLSGTERAGVPFWSPDSRSIGFIANGQLKTIDIAGGRPQTICAVPGQDGIGTWSSADVILFSTPSSGGVYRVAAVGGAPTRVTTLESTRGELAHLAPRFLPDGRRFLYAVRSTNVEHTGAYVGSLDSIDTVKVLDVISKAQYVPPDLLLFTRENTLWAQPFDISRMRLSGEPARVADGIAVMLANAVYGFSASENGVLVLAWDQTAALDMSWYDRTGKLLSQVAVGTFVGIDVSPDGKQVAAHRHDAASNGGDVSINDLERGTESRFTFEPSADNSSPIWSPDGKVIAFGAVRNGRWGLYRKAANSTGAEELLFESPTPVMPMTWSADGQTLVFASLHPKTLHDLWSLPLAGERKPTALVETVESDTHAQISPDGQWMSYRSGPELHVQRYPTGGQKYTVARGLISRWREDGRELFFNSSAGGGEIWTVAVEPIGDGLRFGTPRVLFDSRWAQLGHRPEGLPYFTYAVSPDGERFLIPRMSQTADEKSRALTVVLNWQEELKRRVTAR